MTNLPTNDALLNRRNKLTYDRRALESLLAQTNVCPVSQIELRRSEFVSLKPELSKSDFIYGDGSLPYTELLSGDFIAFLVERQNVAAQTTTLARALVSELIERQATEQVIAELSADVQAQKLRVEAMKKLLDRQQSHKVSQEFRNQIAKIYANLVERNKASRKNVRVNDKELIWKFKTFECEKLTFPKEVIRAFFSVSGKTILLVDQTGNLILLDAARNCILDSSSYAADTRTIIECFILDNSEDIRLTFVHSDQVVVYTFSNQTKKLDLANPQPRLRQTGFEDWYLHPSRIFVIGRKDNALIFASAESFEVTSTLTFGNRSSAVCLHPDGKLLLLNDLARPGHIDFFDLIENKVMTSFDAGRHAIHAIVFSDDRFTFAVKQNQQSQVVDIRKLEAIYTFESVNCLAIKFNSSGSLLGALFPDRVDVHFPKIRQVISSIPLQSTDPLDFMFVPTGNSIKVILKSIIMIINFIE